MFKVTNFFLSSALIGSRKFRHPGGVAPKCNAFCSVHLQACRWCVEALQKGRNVVSLPKGPFSSLLIAPQGWDRPKHVPLIQGCHIGRWESWDGAVACSAPSILLFVIVFFFFFLNVTFLFINKLLMGKSWKKQGFTIIYGKSAGSQKCFQEN